MTPNHYTPEMDTAIRERNLPDDMLAASLGISKQALQKRRGALRGHVVELPASADYAERERLLREEVEVYEFRIQAAQVELRWLVQQRDKKLAALKEIA